MNQQMTNAPSSSTTTIVAQRVAKRCACGTQFLAQSPKHDKCRGCHIAARKEAARKEAERMAAVKAVEENRAKAALAISAMKDGFFKNKLPEGAVVKRSGRQVVVSCMGKSVTFYTN